MVYWTFPADGLLSCIRPLDTCLIFNGSCIEGLMMMVMRSGAGLQFILCLMNFGLVLQLVNPNLAFARWFLVIPKILLQAWRMQVRFWCRFGILEFWLSLLSFAGRGVLVRSCSSVAAVCGLFPSVVGIVKFHSSCALAYFRRLGLLLFCATTAFDDIAFGFFAFHCPLLYYWDAGANWYSTWFLMLHFGYSLKFTVVGFAFHRTRSSAVFGLSFGAAF